MTTSYLRLPPRVAVWRHRQRRHAAGAFTPSRRTDPAQRTFRQFQYLMPPSGNYDSSFPDDLAFEEWLALPGTAHDCLADSEHVSGPAFAELPAPGPRRHPLRRLSSTGFDGDWISWFPGLR